MYLDLGQQGKMKVDYQKNERSRKPHGVTFICTVTSKWGSYYSEGYFFTYFFKYVTSIEQ